MLLRNRLAVFYWFNMNREQDLPTPDELQFDLFDLELAVLKNQNKAAGVLDVDVDENYHPFDAEYVNETIEDSLYEGFATGISFVTLALNEESFVDRHEDVFRAVGERFDQHIDMLSLKCVQAGLKKEANLVQNLTLEGAGDYAGKRYNYYLGKIRDGEVDPEDLVGYSQDVDNWMWAYLTFSRAADIN